MKPLRLVVGLGNPGENYADNRHNLGFWFVDRLAKQLDINMLHETKFHGQTGRSKDLWLLKPNTYMNKSGQSVVALALYYKILPDEILVIHDELDLPPGSIRLKQGGGNGGHNGLRSIQSHLSTPDFWRLRLGIGHPGDKDAVSAYVLKAPSRKEEEDIMEALNQCLNTWKALSSGDFAAAQRLLHKKTPSK